MSASQAPTLESVALQLGVGLGRYDEAVTAMLQSWPDMERYAEVSKRIEDIRVLAGMLPRLASIWVELLIAHAELVHGLWRIQYADPQAPAGILEPLCRHHARCVGDLRAGCARLASMQECSPGVSRLSRAAGR